jgi:hypothetical protein
LALLAGASALGHRGQPKPQLVGAHGAGGGSVGEQIELTFLDAVFHLAARAIELLEERAGPMLVGLQRGDDEARIAVLDQPRVAAAAALLFRLHLDTTRESRPLLGQAANAHFAHGEWRFHAMVSRYFARS